MAKIYTDNRVVTTSINEVSDDLDTNDLLAQAAEVKGYYNEEEVEELDFAH